jgi:uncharacterized protein (TIGR04255 family)
VNKRVEHYRNAPIVEAVLDIEVRAASPMPTQSAFKDFANSISAKFPQFAELNQFQLNVVGSQSGSTVGQSMQASGIRLVRPANDRVVMAQPRGLSFSHLPKYTTWSEFRSEARALWDRYVDTVKPLGVTRMALRYINRIDIPQAKFELDDYFAFYPNVPKSLPDDISGFFTQVQIPQLDMPATSIAFINFSSAGQPKENTCTVVIDIDVVTMREMAISSDEVFNHFDEIRARKNEIFESCITDKTRKLFQ